MHSRTAALATLAEIATGRHAFDYYKPRWAAYLLTQDKARRIAANIAKLPQPLDG
jgi:hypothetical protein